MSHTEREVSPGLSMLEPIHRVRKNEKLTLEEQIHRVKSRLSGMSVLIITAIAVS